MRTAPLLTMPHTLGHALRAIETSPRDGTLAPSVFGPAKIRTETTLPLRPSGHGGRMPTAHTRTNSSPTPALPTRNLPRKPVVASHPRANVPAWLQRPYRPPAPREHPCELSTAAASPPHASTPPLTLHPSDPFWRVPSPLTLPPTPHPTPLPAPCLTPIPKAPAPAPAATRRSVIPYRPPN